VKKQTYWINGGWLKTNSGEEWEHHHNRKSHLKVQVCGRSFFEIDNWFIDLFVFDGRFKKNIRPPKETGFLYCQIV
jgi:hypothetical protein